MKKIIMKSFIVGCFLLMILINGCTSSKNIEKKQINTSETNMIGMNIMLAESVNSPKYDHIKEWEAFMKENYKIEINIEYIAATDFIQYGMGKYIPEVIQDGYEGFIFIGKNSWQIEDLAKKGLILPLSEYLDNNEIFRALPARMKEQLKLTDGEMWSIPVSDICSPYIRLYNNEWLTKLELKKPETLEELYEALKGFTYGDPNNTKAQDTYGISVKRDYELSSLMDLFLANGCYIAPTGVSSITFDRQTGTYEDSFLKSGARETLELISSMTSEGIVKQTDIKSFKDYTDSKNIGSYADYVSIGDNSDFADYSYSFYLKGYNEVKTYLGIATAITSSYVLSANTKNPQEIVDKFINTFYGSDEGYYSAFSGLKDIDYLYENKLFTDISGIKGVRILNVYSPYLKSNGYSSVDNNNVEEYSSFEFFENEANMLSTNNMLYFAGLSDGPYTFPNFSDSARLLVNKVISQNDSVDNLLKQYLDNMKKGNFQEYIDEMNSKIGKATVNKY